MQREVTMPDRTPANPDVRRPTALTAAPHRLLIVANQTASSPALIAELTQRTQRGPVQLHLVVPALNSRVRHWLSDSDKAVQVAQDRGERARSEMAEHGITLSVEVGDSVPIRAIADALARFDANEILISTLPVDRSHWLERDLINVSRGRFGLPVTHIVAADHAAVAA
jgi:GABA permease